MAVAHCVADPLTWRRTPTLHPNSNDDFYCVLTLARSPRRVHKASDLVRAARAKWAAEEPRSIAHDRTYQP